MDANDNMADLGLAYAKALARSLRGIDGETTKNVVERAFGANPDLEVDDLIRSAIIASLDVLMRDDDDAQIVVLHLIIAHFGSRLLTEDWARLEEIRRQFLGVEEPKIPASDAAECLAKGKEIRPDFLASRAAELKAAREPELDLACAILKAALAKGLDREAMEGLCRTLGIFTPAVHRLIDLAGLRKSGPEQGQDPQSRPRP